MNLVAHIIGSIARVAGAGLRTLLWTIVMIDLLYGVAVTIVCFWIASRDALWKGMVAGVIAFLAIGVCGLIAAVQRAVACMIRTAVEEAAIGQRVFDAIFQIGLGVDDQRPEGRSAMTASLSGLTVREVEDRAHHAAKVVIDAMDAADPVPIVSPLVGVVQWLARRASRMVVWATVRVTVRQCASGPGDDATVDLLAVRDRLGGRIDGLVADYFHKHARALSWALVNGVAIIALLLAWLLAMLPV